MSGSRGTFGGWACGFAVPALENRLWALDIEAVAIIGGAAL
jgi:hypothetical protein